MIQGSTPRVVKYVDNLEETKAGTLYVLVIAGWGPFVLLLSIAVLLRLRKKATGRAVDEAGETESA